MTKARDVIEQIMGDLPRANRGRWFERGTPQQLELIRQVSEAWRSGRLPQVGRRVAPAVHKRFIEAGIQVSVYGVREWLGNLLRQTS